MISVIPLLGLLSDSSCQLVRLPAEQEIKPSEPHIGGIPTLKRQRLIGYPGERTSERANRNTIDTYPNTQTHKLALHTRNAFPKGPCTPV